MKLWHEYGGSAPEIYERHLVPAIFRPWAFELVELASPKSFERVLDVGCGTGVVARYAFDRMGGKGKVVGIDPNPGMLAVARSVSSSPPPSPSSSPHNVTIEWREGSAAAIPLPDASFDLILCQQVLQFVPDRAAAVKEMHRVLVPGGRLVVACWSSIEKSRAFALFAQALATHIGPEAARIMHLPFSLPEAEEMRTLMTGAGFSDVAVRPATKNVRFPSTEDFVETYVAGSPLAGVASKADDKARLALIQDMKVGLRDYEGNSGLEFPMETHLTFARRSIDSQKVPS